MSNDYALRHMYVEKMMQLHMNMHEKMHYANKIVS